MDASFEVPRLQSCYEGVPRVIAAEQFVTKSPRSPYIVLLQYKPRFASLRGVRRPISNIPPSHTVICPTLVRFSVYEVSH